ncbi:HAMP domain-containing histidine kinase [Roseomonas hellenica]|uniref:histidine kinase n=1 Tax=Plastoroseomonas hellenica TaxID=2687306 RepID=A0ABS5EWY8_9PROT|nr:HAMP domain-containing sensor histidine kinase [Plastoroseomonas hellenica]MBR0664817.1 HAMP domain-containing histidine kinase [Plastoroseomonas hellenica]
MRATRCNSLARRLVYGLVAFQALVLIGGILTEPLRESRTPLSQWLAAEEAVRLLAPSIGREPGGRLVLRPEPVLTAYMEANPGFWFFATDGDTLLRGGVDRIDKSEGDSEEAWRALEGTTRYVSTSAGRVAILLGGQRGDFWAGLRGWLTDRLWRIALILLVAGLCTTAVIIGLVHLLLRPVRHAARAAAALTPGQQGPHLPVEKVPAEILPLVNATNAAFARLEEENERQRRFVANAAHELRTPVAILGIRLDELPESAAKHKLRQDVRRLSLLANQLLDLERLHHGGARRESLDLVALARDVVADMGPLAIEDGSSIAFSSEVPRLDILGDEQALRGALSNLIGNALSHGGKGGLAELRIRHDGVVEVADRGAGVPAEWRERVFEPFQRAGGGTGAGLGLYIVREALRAHGATIELRDGEPSGALFRIRFPA